MFQIYILFVQDGDRRRGNGRHPKRFQSKRGRMLLLRFFSFLHFVFFFLFQLINHSFTCISQAPPTPERPDYRERNSRDPHRQHLSCSWLTFTVFQPSAKRETEKTDEEDGGENGGGVTNG